MTVRPPPMAERQQWTIWQSVSGAGHVLGPPTENTKVIPVPPADEAVEQAGEAIVSALRGRRGLRQEWDMIDPDIQAEAKEALARAALSSVGLIEPSPQGDK